MEGDYEHVNQLLICRFQNATSPEDDVRAAVNETLDPNHLPDSLFQMEKLFEKTGFDKDVKYGILKNAVKAVPGLAHFVFYRGADDFNTLKEAVLEFWSGRDSLQEQLACVRRKFFTYGPCCPRSAFRHSTNRLLSINDKKTQLLIS